MHTQLHALEMMTGMMEDEYMAKLEILVGKTGFNVALEDTFIWGLPQLILSKVYSQTLLLSGLENWKTVIHNLDCIHWEFTKLKQSIHLRETPFPEMQTPIDTQMPDT